MRRRLLVLAVVVSVACAAIGAAPAAAEEPGLSAEARRQAAALRDAAGLGTGAYELLRSGRVAVAITQEGDMLKVVSVDYAFWQEDLAGAITAFIDSVAGQPATAREIWLRGKASPRFQQELRERAWTVHEAFELDLRKKSAGS